MFAFSFVAVFVSLSIFAFPFGTSALLALVTALVAALVEALSPFGFDNLTVPLTSAATLVLAGGLLS